MSRKGLLLILDGYGEGAPNDFNAVANAKTPFLNKLKSTRPMTLLYTHGKYVGLSDNTMMGGSEVGHQNIGAGRVVKSVLYRINEDMKTGRFFENKILSDCILKAQKHNGAVHIIGLFSDKNIHSNINHMFAIMEVCKKLNVQKVFIHPITDGRDSGVTASEKYFGMLNNVIKKFGIGEVASVGGRFFAMDREQNMDRTAEGFNAMFFNDEKIDNALEYVKSQHKLGISDENIVPKRVRTMSDSSIRMWDCLVFFNFREDRMRQLLAMTNERLIDKISVVTMTDYNSGCVKAKALYKEENIEGVLSGYISELGLKQLKISETTKYAHVTYFINGRREQPFLNEDRIHIPTLKVTDYASKPAMRAYEIGDEIIKAIKSDRYDLIIVNFSNPDMIGHTANYKATKKCLEILDGIVKKVVTLTLKKDYATIVTADHGNAEELRDKAGNLQTAHSLNPVPFIIVDNKYTNLKMSGGALCDVAPTLLRLMELPPNPKFEGKVLFKN